MVTRTFVVPVLVVGTVRTGEPHEDEELLAELALEPAAVVLRPATLSAGAVAELVGRRLGEPVSPLFALACHRTTSGNPLLLRVNMGAGHFGKSGRYDALYELAEQYAFVFACLGIAADGDPAAESAT